MELRAPEPLLQEALELVQSLTEAERKELMQRMIQAFPERFAYDPATGVYNVIPREAPPCGGSCL